MDKKSENSHGVRKISPVGGEKCMIGRICGSHEYSRASSALLASAKFYCLFTEMCVNNLARE